MSEIYDDRVHAAVIWLVERRVVNCSGPAQVELGEGRVEVELPDARGVVRPRPVAVRVVVDVQFVVVTAVESVLSAVAKDVLLRNAVNIVLFELGDKFTPPLIFVSKSI